MSQETTEAVVLRGVEFSESSRIVTFLTPARGRLACIAKGVRRKNSPLGGVLDTFNRVELLYYWKEGRQVQNLAEATVLDGFRGFKSDLERLTYAGFPLELAGKVAHENEPSQRLYTALVHGLERLDGWTGDVRAHTAWQVLRLLCAAGHEPVLDRCVLCGGAITAAPGFAFEGGVTCRNCRADRRLSEPAYAALCALRAAEDNCPEVGEAAEVLQVLRQYAVQQLETDFRSVRVLDEMFG